MKLTPRKLALLAAGVIALVALGGWFAVVSPQRSKVDNLETKIADGQATLAATQATLSAAQSVKTPHKAARPKPANAAALAKAMPSRLQMPGILRQVQRLAAGSRVTVESFTPSTATPAAGYDSVPIALSATGRYASVQRFLHRLRAQAGMAGTRVYAHGRLFDVQSVSLTPSGAEAHALTAAIQLAAFVYTGAALPAADATTTAPDAATGTESS